MKLLVIGNGEQLDNTIDFFSELNFGVVGKSLNHDDVTGITKTIMDSLEKGYGLIIAYVNDGIGASIYLNRDKKIRAAPCSTELDVELAKKNNANVILLSTEANVHTSMLKPLKEVHSGRVVETHLKKNKEEHRHAIKHHESEEIQTQRVGRTLKNEEVEEEEEEAPEHMHRGKKGFFKGIKDSLGIVDE